jgi:hypothetical protein
MQDYLTATGLAAVDVIQQELDRLPSQIMAGDATSRKRRRHQPRQWNIVVTDDGQIARYIQAQICARLQRAHGHQIVVAKEGGQFRMSGE